MSDDRGGEIGANGPVRKNESVISRIFSTVVIEEPR
jgi:hypothetical protein